MTRHRILDETLEFLLSRRSASPRRISSLHLSNYYTVVALDDGSVGAAFSAYQLRTSDLVEIQRCLRSNLREDPLLLTSSELSRQDEAIATTIRTAVANALSAPLLCRGRDSVFVSSEDFPWRFFQDISYAVVIGFGGFLEHLILHTGARRIHVSEHHYRLRRNEIDSKLARYRRWRPSVILTVSDGSDSTRRLRYADFVSITGSTLCNNTLEPLLVAARDSEKIVVQGQSASIYPKALFAAGVNLLVTTLKSREVLKAAAADPAVRGLTSLLEGALPPLYIWPRERPDSSTAPSRR